MIPLDLKFIVKSLSTVEELEDCFYKFLKRNNSLPGGTSGAGGPVADPPWC